MIGWHIKLGYVSGYTGDGDWETVKELAAAVPMDLAEETKRFAAFGHHDKIDEVVATYKSETGNPFHVSDDEIMILAGAGGDYRRIKEMVARAFVRLLMRAVHERGFDISVTVA